MTAALIAVALVMVWATVVIFFALVGMRSWRVSTKTTRWDRERDGGV